MTETTQHPVVVTQEIVTARFNKELTALKFQDAIQAFENFEVTAENIAQAQEKNKKVRAFIRQIGAIKDAGKKPALEECRFWDAAHNSIKNTIETILNRKETELQTIVNKVAEENRLREQERMRVQSIEKDIDNTLLNHSQAIAQATKNETLVAIEKLLGSQKANKARFQEFLPRFVERCAELTPLIKKQKEAIKELEELAKQAAQAEKDQDDRKLLELRDQQEKAQDKLEETKIVVQEITINQATRPDITVPEPVATEIKYRRTTWKWEVKDIKELAKKAPHLVQILPDEDKIDELLKTKKADGSLKDVEEVDYMGIRFFLEKKA